jgi:hypothetical protein
MCVSHKNASRMGISTFLAFEDLHIWVFRLSGHFE